MAFAISITTYSLSLVVFLKNEFELTTNVLISSALVLHSLSIISQSASFLKIVIQSSKDICWRFTSAICSIMKHYLYFLLEDTFPFLDLRLVL